MPHQRRSKESQETKDNRRIKRHNQQLTSQSIIDTHSDYTLSIKHQHRESKQRQIKFLKRIRFRLPDDILGVIQGFLTKQTTAYIDFIQAHKHRLEYFRFIDNIGGIVSVNVNQKPYLYMSPICPILKALECVPISILDLFIQSSIVTNCHELVKDKYERDIHYYCASFILRYRYKFKPDVWIYKYRLERLILSLHQRIGRGDSAIIPITRRLIKAIFYLRDHCDKYNCKNDC